MKRVLLSGILLLTLSACAPTATPPSSSPSTPPVPQSGEGTQSQAPHTQSPPPPPPPSPSPKEPEAIDLEFHVAPSKDGPWTPYSPGVHVDGTKIWVKIEANQPLPGDALDRLTKQRLFTPGIQGERQSDRAVLLTSEGPAIWIFPGALLPKDSKMPAIWAFAGRPPEVREWDPSTGRIKRLAVLRDLPSMYTRTNFDAEHQTLTYTPLHKEGAVEVNLQTGKPKDIPKPVWPSGSPRVLPYTLVLSSGQSLRPDTTYSIQVTEAKGESGKVILELPNLNPITPFNPCLPFTAYHSWSPDGRRLAFATMEPPDAALLLVDVGLGTSKTLLRRPVGETGWNAHLSWSPNGRWLVFHDALVEAATGQVVTNEVGRLSHWRPDGQFLVASDEEIFRGWGPLRVIAPDQGKVLLEAEGRFITWTPEGRLLYFDWPNGSVVPIGPKDCS